MRGVVYTEASSEIALAVGLSSMMGILLNWERK